MTRQRRLVIPLEGLEGDPGQVRTRNHDHIGPTRWLIAAKDLSNQPFSEISLDRATDLPGGGNAEARDGQVGREQKHGHVSRLNPRSPLIDTLKVSASPDVLVAAERVPHGIVRG
jgi:hypothetical protein